jgi:hypothetical protein
MCQSCRRSTRSAQNPLSPRHAGIRGHRYCVVLPDHVSAALTRRHVAARRRTMRAPGPYRSARRLILMTFPGGFEESLRILAEASRSGDLGEAAYARASHECGINWVE